MRKTTIKFCLPVLPRQTTPAKGIHSINLTVAARKSRLLLTCFLGLTILVLTWSPFSRAKDSGQPRQQAFVPLPGQLIADTNNLNWLKRSDGHHVFICAPGGLADFLYRGERNPDGTRTGDQEKLIAKLAREGGNCIYMEIIRAQVGTEAQDPTQNPFMDSDPGKGLNDQILEQWARWFTAMDNRGIYIYLTFYGNGARIWNTGAEVLPAEQAFVKQIVKRFQHYKNLIWGVATESQTNYPPERIQQIANIIRQTDGHGHLIGARQDSGTTFRAWQPDASLGVLALQCAPANAGEAHAAALAALHASAGRYAVICLENTIASSYPGNERRFAWASAMAGVMPLLRQRHVTNAPVACLNQCRYLQHFFESSDFWRMTPHDELRYAGTKYVLAAPGQSYIAYTTQSNLPLGLKELPSGRYSMKWLDCRTGLTLRQMHTFVESNQVTFWRPSGIGPECAVWIHQSRP